MSDTALADATKALGEISGKLETFATKSDAQSLDKKLNDLEQSVKEIKVGDANSTKDKNAGFKHIGEFGLAVYKAAVEKDVDERLLAHKEFVQKGVSNPSGSSTLDFPLPAGFVPGIRTTDYPGENLAGMCQNIPIDDGQQSIELTYADDTNRSGGTTYGGILAYTKAEAEQMQGTKPSKRHIRLEPQEVYAFAYATDKLLRNSPIAFGSWLKDGMQKALEFKKNDLIVNGLGNPVRGILNSPDKITIAKETSQGGATIGHVNVSKMWKRMPANWRSNAIWLANQDIEDQLDRMARSAIKNDGTGLESADTPSAYNVEKNTIYGRPIVFSEFAPTLGTEGDLILWAPQKYLVATKAGQGMEQSIHLRFDYAETAFRVIIEVDGKSEYPAPLTPYKGATTRSSIVTLAVRA